MWALERVNYSFLEGMKSAFDLFGFAAERDLEAFKSYYKNSNRHFRDAWSSAGKSLNSGIAQYEEEKRRRNQATEEE